MIIVQHIAVRSGKHGRIFVGIRSGKHEHKIGGVRFALRIGVVIGTGNAVREQLRQGRLIYRGTPRSKNADEKYRKQNKTKRLMYGFHSTSNLR